MVIQPLWNLQMNPFFVFMVMEFVSLGNIRELRELSASRWHKKMYPHISAIT